MSEYLSVMDDEWDYDPDTHKSGELEYSIL